jgi:hypothetical protein
VGSDARAGLRHPGAGGVTVAERSPQSRSDVGWAMPSHVCSSSTEKTTGGLTIAWKRAG